VQIAHTVARAPQVSDFLRRRGMAVIARRGELVEVLDLSSIVGWQDGAIVGALSYDIVSADCEIVTLHVARQWSGIGSRLIAEAVNLAVAAGCQRLWVVTTNDNVDALRFYQRRGFRLSAVRCGAVDDARRILKPTIAEFGEYGIAIRDELELTAELPLAATPGS
jgi:ribosomal protein S18 acetylase RimI-like enzyme